MITPSMLIAKDESDVQKNFANTLLLCQTALHSSNQAVNTWGWTSFGIAMVGALAGSVIVPALTAASAEANRVAITTFGGISGLANTAQQGLDKQGFAAEARGDREQLRKDFFGAVSKFTKAKDDEGAKLEAVAEMKAACLSYAVLAGLIREPSAATEKPPEKK